MVMDWIEVKLVFVLVGQLSIVISVKYESATYDLQRSLQSFIWIWYFVICYVNLINCWLW